MESQSNTMLECALSYYQSGWNPIPIEERSKRPKIPWEQFQNQRVTETLIREWWGRWPQCNLGIVTGAISNLVVVDVDSEEAMQTLLPYLGEEPLRCKTGKGTHLYYKHPGGRVPNMVGILKGIDIRADGGLVVAPPSIHANGQRYAWLNQATVINLPLKLLNLIHQVKSQPQKHKKHNWERPIPEGQRDDKLTNYVGKLLQQGHPPGAVLAMAKGLNADFCQPPLSNEQVEKIVNSIWKRESGKERPEQEEPFQLRNFVDFMTGYTLNDIQWLVEDWIPKASIGMIVGPPESFKTWLMLDLAVCITGGSNFLGSYEIKKPGSAILFQQEDGHINTARRLNLITYNHFPQKYSFRESNDAFEIDIPSLPLHIREFGALTLDNPKSIDKLWNVVADIRPLLVVLEPLYSIVDTKDYMMGAARAMLMFKKIRDQYGTSFVIGHHNRKGSVAGEREEMWGSQFLNAYVEWQWQLRKDRQGDIVLKRYGKIFGKQPDVLLKFNINMGQDWKYEVEVEEAVAEDMPNTLKESFVRDCLEQNLSYRKIADLCKARFGVGISLSSISKIKQEMTKMEDFSRIGKD